MEPAISLQFWLSFSAAGFVLFGLSAIATPIVGERLEAAEANALAFVSGHSAMLVYLGLAPSLLTSLGADGQAICSKIPLPIAIQCGEIGAAVGGHLWAWVSAIVLFGISWELLTQLSRWRSVAPQRPFLLVLTYIIPAILLSVLQVWNILAANTMFLALLGPTFVSDAILKQFHTLVSIYREEIVSAGGKR